MHADIRCLFLPVNKSSVYMESLSSTTNPKPTCRYRQILVHIIIRKGKEYRTHYMVRVICVWKVTRQEFKH